MAVMWNSIADAIGPTPSFSLGTWSRSLPGISSRRPTAVTQSLTGIPVSAGLAGLQSRGMLLCAIRHILDPSLFSDFHCLHPDNPEPLGARPRREAMSGIHQLQLRPDVSGRF